MKFRQPFFNDKGRSAPYAMHLNSLILILAGVENPNYLLPMDGSMVTRSAGRNET